MTPRWHKVIIAASLYKVGDRSAIDLKIEGQIPSKFGALKTMRRPLG